MMASVNMCTQSYYHTHHPLICLSLVKMTTKITLGVNTIFLFWLVREVSLLSVNSEWSYILKARRILPELSSVHEILLLYPGEGEGAEGEVCQGLRPPDGGAGPWLWGGGGGDDRHTTAGDRQHYKGPPSCDYNSTRYIWGDWPNLFYHGHLRKQSRYVKLHLISLGFPYFPLIADNSPDENNCPMRENIQNCRIYLCKVVKNIMSIGFPCYSQWIWLNFTYENIFNITLKGAQKCNCAKYR